MFWKDKHVGPVIESLNRIFVESLNSKEIKKDIKSINQEIDIKGYGSLKTLQVWLENRARFENASDVMCPFFVLYDFRVMTNHLQPSDKKLEIKKSINTRLGLDIDNENYEEIFDKIIDMLISSYTEILSKLSC